jgi:ribonuclease J
VFVEGESGSELDVREQLVREVAKCKGRVLVTTFASNVARLQSIVHAATANGRRVAVSGRAMHRMILAAKESGYLEEMAELLSEEEAMQLPRDEVLLLITGSQGESRAGLWRVAAREHPTLRLSPGDTVLFSSREIPGNEKRIGIVQNRLIQSGVNVVNSRETMIHVSGHPARGELTRMYQMTKPQISIPVHGEQRHMNAHAKLALDLQVPHAVVGANGSVIRLDVPDPKVVGQVPSGYVAVDGAQLLPADGYVMRMRRRMRDEGMVFASVLVTDRGEVEDVQIAAPGLLDAKEDADWLAGLREDVADAVEAKGKKADSTQQQDAVRHTIRRLFQQELMKKPMVQVHLHRV